VPLAHPLTLLTEGLYGFQERVSDMSTATINTQYDEWTLMRIWFSAREAPGTNGVDARIDCFGNLMRWSQYGETTEHGWEVDHVIPKSHGGSGDISNLRPLHWKAN
jgi:hypothetical protein